MEKYFRGYELMHSFDELDSDEDGSYYISC